MENQNKNSMTLETSAKIEKEISMSLKMGFEDNKMESENNKSIATTACGCSLNQGEKMKLTKEAFKNVLENKIDWNKVLIELATTDCNKPVLIFNDGSFCQDHTGYEEDEILCVLTPGLNDAPDEECSDGWCDHDEETGDYITHKNFGGIRTLTRDEMVIESITEGDHEVWIDFLKIKAFGDYFITEGCCRLQDDEIRNEYFSIPEMEAS